jgi:hypothetical protein
MSLRFLRRRDEQGVALILAVAICSIFVTISASLAVTVMNNVGSVERGVLSASSSQSATAGLNYAISTLSNDISTSASTYPCSLTSSGSESSTGQVSESYTVTLTYYSSVNSAASPPTASGALTCSSGTISSSSSIAAVGITDTGTAGANRTSTTKLSALYSLSSGSSFAGGFGIYDDAGVQFNNSISATANTGTIFVNGAAQCNSATINGSLYIYDPGDTNSSSINSTDTAGYLTNSCTINGALDVNGDVDISTSSPKVTGNSLVQGNVSISNTDQVFQGNLTATGTITTPTSTYVKGTATANGSVTLPSPASFPILAWNSSAWTSAGWTVDSYSPASCGSWQNPTPLPTLPNNVYAELLQDAAYTTPTVLYTNCPLSGFPQNVTIKFASNFAIVDTSTSGMSFTEDNLESTSSTAHDLYLIVPADPASPTTSSQMSLSTCGSNYEIVGQNQEYFGTTANPLDVLIYDPCEVYFTNGGTLTGQIVAGTLGASITNQFNFTFVNPGTAPGTTSSATGLTALDQYVVSSS